MLEKVKQRQSRGTLTQVKPHVVVQLRLHAGNIKANAFLLHNFL